MAKQIALERFTSELFQILDETFEQVHGIYLDRGTSLFETLDGISAQQASRPVSATCASIAAQVDHVTFYLQVLQDAMQHIERGKVDWSISWQRTAVSAEEWEALKQQLRATYTSVKQVMHSFETWDGDDEIAGALAIVVHTAYHLGEIRQALCTLR